jgi:hypothetical protein
MADVVDLLRHSQERLKKLKEQAEKAARDAAEAHERAEAWDRADPSEHEAIGLVYPWNERPWELRLDRFEIDLALKFANLNIDKAARILKISVERLELALEQYLDLRPLVRKRERYQERARKQNEALNAPVTARYDGPHLIVTIKKPRFQSEASLGTDEAGNLVVVITRDDDTYRDLIKTAEEIAKENGP